MRNRHRGTTLLEVLLGLALLATLLASVIVARGRFIRQWADADRKLKLIAAADRLMGELVNDSPEQLASAGGPIAEIAASHWQTRLIRDDSAVSVGVYKFRLDVVDEHASAAPVRIEFLVHDRHPTPLPAGAR